jgi:hypothetical protein
MNKKRNMKYFINNFNHFITETEISPKTYTKNNINPSRAYEKWQFIFGEKLTKIYPTIITEIERNIFITSPLRGLNMI